MLFRRRWIILTVFALSLAVAGFMAYKAMQNRVFTTSSLVLADVRRIPVTVPTASDDPDELFARSGTGLEDELFMLRVSEPLTRQAGEVIKKRLEEQGARANAEYPVLLRGQAPQDLTPMQIGERARMLVGFASEKLATNMVRVIGTGPSPFEVALATNGYAQAYEQITQKVSLRKASRSEDALQSLVDQRKADLDTAEGALRSYLEANPTASLSSSGVSLNEQVFTLEAQEQQLERTLVEMRSDLASLREREQLARSSIGDMTVARLQAALRAEEGRLQEATRAREAHLNAYRGIRDNPSAFTQDKVVRLRELDTQYERLYASVETLNKQYTQALFESSGVVGPEGEVGFVQTLKQQIRDLEGRISAQEQNLNSVRRNLGEYSRRLGALPTQQSRLAELQREVQLRENEYNNAVGTLRGNDLQQSTEGGYVQVIQPAFVPSQPIPSNALQTLLLGGFLGLLLGGGLAVVLELSSNRLYKQEDVEKLNVNVLDFLPYTEVLSDKNRKKRITVGSFDVSAAVLTLFSPYGPYVEALRKLEASLQFTQPDSKVFLVTSSRPGEGKSVTTANLAGLFARSGKRTLLIDGDLRRPQVHNLFGVPNKTGLANLLMPDAHANAYSAFADIGVENLTILPAGTSSRISTELLQGEGFRRLLDEVRDDFDMILVDSPPVLAISDAEVMSRHVDAVLVMCRAGVTRAGELTSALESLKRAKANVAGAVLNGFKITMAYGYRYRYGKYAGKGYYGYGYDLTPKPKAKA